MSKTNPLKTIGIIRDDLLTIGCALPIANVSAHSKVSAILGNLDELQKQLSQEQQSDELILTTHEISAGPDSIICDICGCLLHEEQRKKNDLLVDKVVCSEQCLVKALGSDTITNK